MEIVVISDIHVAKFWDRIRKVYPGKFVNPNDNFREFLKGVLDEQPLVINGDLVDYYYADREGEKSNWDLLHDMLSVRKGEFFHTLGNHDYRRRPYNITLTGLKYIGMKRDDVEKYAAALGHSKFLGFKELECFTVNLKRFNPLTKTKEARYFSRELKDKTLLFLDTGPDAITKFRNWFRWPYPFCRHTASEGLDQEQIDLVRMTLAESGEKELIIFMHAPPFAAKRAMGSVKLGWFFYGWRLFSQGLNYGTFVRNNWRFMKMLMESEKNITIIGSHTHIAKQYIVDKRLNVVRQSDVDEINQLRKDERFIKVLTTLPMGTIKTLGKQTGYMVIGDEITYHVMHDFGKDL